MPPRRIAVCLEVTPKQAVASALDWPGWCRAGRDEGAALEALAGYAGRYAPVAGQAGVSFPATVAFDVIERVPGGPATAFAAPECRRPFPQITAEAERAKVTPAAARRLADLVTAAWMTRARSRAAGTASAAVAALLTPALAATPAVAASPLACTGWVVKPSPSTGAATLHAAAATSGRDVWAVGSYNTGGAYKTLIEHWGGARWRIVPASGFHTTNTLSAVVAITASNAWAFGFYEKTTTSFRTLVEHWNGSTWSVVPSPNSGTGENTLAAAVARSATNIWAVGYRGDSQRRTLTEHWNGSKWSIVPSPSVGSGDNFLFGAAAAAGGPVWAVGSDSVSFGRTLAMRWNGQAWTVATTANPGGGDRFLQAVAVPAARYALAVGSYLR